MRIRLRMAVRAILRTTGGRFLPRVAHHGVVTTDAKLRAQFLVGDHTRDRFASRDSSLTTRAALPYQRPPSQPIWRSRPPAKPGHPARGRDRSLRTRKGSRGQVRSGRRDRGRCVKRSAAVTSWAACDGALVVERWQEQSTFADGSRAPSAIPSRFALWVIPSRLKK